jgi:hypothetical protein
MPQTGSRTEAEVGGVVSLWFTLSKDDMALPKDSVVLFSPRPVLRVWGNQRIASSQQTPGAKAGLNVSFLA